MTYTDLQALNGSMVLVRQTAPPFPGTPVAVRGTLRVTEDRGDGLPGVEVVLSFPAMFTSPAWDLAIPLNAAQVAELLETENNGTYSYTYRGSLDDARPRVPVAKVIEPR